MQTGGDGSNSVCTKPSFAPIHYHWWRIDPKRTLVDEVRQIVAGMQILQVDRDLLMGQVTTRLLELVRGELKPIEHIKGPLGTVRNIAVYELRCGVDLPDGRTAQIRIYHVEPKKFKVPGGSTVVGLHVHEKLVKRTDSATTRAQNKEIAKAAKRYWQGTSSDWGDAQLLPRAQ